MTPVKGLVPIADRVSRGEEPPCARGFDFRGLRCAPVPGDEESWHYLPKHPDLRRDAHGVPNLTVVEFSETAFLLFTATWAAPEPDLEALRHELAARWGGSRPVQVRLVFAPVTELRCEALAGDGSGPLELVATSATSGIAPYDAVFSLALSGDQSVAAEARHGRPGLLAVEYSAVWPQAMSGSATLTVETDRLAGVLSARTSAPAFRRLLEAAVREGWATVTVDVAERHLATLSGALYDRVLVEATRALPNWLDHPAPGVLRVSVTLEQQVDEPVRASIDIGSVIAEATTRAAPGGLHAAD